MSMIKKIAAGYGKAFRTAGFVVLLIICCTLISAAVVYPLWLLAEKNAAAYTITAVSVLVFLLIITAVIRLVHFLSRDGVTDDVRQQRIHTVVVRTATVVFFAVSAVLFVGAVMSGRRRIGFCVLAAAFVIYGVVAFGFNKKNG